jgi:hypothetical protein
LSMPDGSRVIEMRCYWPDPARLLSTDDLHPVQ